MKMIKILTILFLSTFMLQAQDITNKLGGNTANETYDVTDSADNVLFRVQGDGNVLIGAASTSAQLSVDSGLENIAINGESFYEYAFRGFAHNTTGTNYGGFFEAAGLTGIGVAGYAGNSDDGTNFGGHFQAHGLQGRGVYGLANNIGNHFNYGGYFESYGVKGYGVYGEAHGATGVGIFGKGTYRAGYFDGYVQITGGLQLHGEFKDASGDAGTSGQLLSSTATGTHWIDAPSGGTSGWSLTGNSGTTAGTNFVGTTDDTALEFKVNSQRVIRYEPDAISPNIIGGYNGNSVSAGVEGAFIGGGGRSGDINIVTANYGSVIGGYGNTASGDYSTAMGRETNATEFNSFAMGRGTTASGGRSVASGYGSTASGSASFAMGAHTLASGASSVTMGNYTTASGYGSTAIGSYTTASGFYSIAVGRETTASGDTSAATGYLTIASGNTSTAMGYGTTASGDKSTAMGYETIASGAYSTAIGRETNATEFNSFAMGRGTTASGGRSVASGYGSTASGSASFAMGAYTLASGTGSVSMGFQTDAESQYSVALGKYNVGGGTADSWVDAEPLFEIGIGTDDTNRANALTVLKSGNIGVGTETPDATLDVHGTVKAFGAWDNSLSFGTVYTAQSDGFVVAYSNIGGSSELIGITDSSAPPTTIRTIAERSDPGHINIMMPVKKGNMWKVDRTGVTASGQLFWIPLGQ